MKHYAWATTKEEALHMKKRQKENLISSKTNKAENWFNQKLLTTNYKWSRQSIWGVRLYDFWCHYLGIAIEIDGIEHDKNRDYVRDKTDYEVSGIIILRVRNFNEEDANRVIKEINNKNENWNDRRIRLGLKPIKNL